MALYRLPLGKARQRLEADAGDLDGRRGNPHPRRLSGAFRVFYVAKFAEAVYVLHCFQKKSQKTDPRDLELGRKRFTGAAGGTKRMNRRRVGF